MVVRYIQLQSLRTHQDPISFHYSNRYYLFIIILNKNNNNKLTHHLPKNHRYTITNVCTYDCVVNQAVDVCCVLVIRKYGKPNMLPLIIVVDYERGDTNENKIIIFEWTTVS